MEEENNFGSGGGPPGHLDKFKKIMSDLWNDAMEHFQVLELAKAVNLSAVTSFSRPKSLLLKFVLEQIWYG